MTNSIVLTFLTNYCKQLILSSLKLLYCAVNYNCKNILFKDKIILIIIICFRNSNSNCYQYTLIHNTCLKRT